ncbi:efflux RND transporter periplasmic adaptor subunit [Rothia nasimurium]|uniref:Efflux RND transporter periplasmic adaptor subunit n=1 Tax=Luteibacter anthropi TaxID=564369 RepID=A0A7X5U828_9GAMM|nr:efflux RND transporter periplasmic adaptor subunit [Luteibacter anthropi]NII05621.1 efflux RND transporter periplasmic adaptor subunit [Luteibacter anthropi]
MRPIAPVLPPLRVGLATTFAVLLAACTSHADTSQAPPPPEVGVAPVVARHVKTWDEFNGRISAIETVSIRPRVTGYIDRIAYREGDEVKPGDVLFVIDQRPYRDALNSAQAQLERARAAATLSQAQDERAQKLIAAHAISRDEYDSRHADLAQTAADVRAAQAAVATAQLNLGFTEVRAPVAGRAGRAMLTMGNLAQADQSELTTVVSQDPVFVYFDCDEQSYLRFMEGARGGRQQNAVRVGLANEKGFPRTGKVDFLDNRVDSATGTIRARALLSNADRVLTPGLYARVQMEGSHEFEAMLIDDKAVLTDQDRKYVYVVGPDDKALRKDVTLGRLVDGLRVVQTGLAAGDKVIVTGTQKIYFPGMAVKPQPMDHGAAVAQAAK